MTQSKHTKRALLSSVLAMLVCVAMLIGSTFAWFTDSVTSGKNKIVAGNLDVNLAYTMDGSTWTNVDAGTNLFRDDTLWEPGHVEVAYLKVENLGTLALKYEFSINAVDTVTSVSVLGNELALSKYLKYAVVELTADEDGNITTFGGRTDAMSKVTPENETDLTIPYKVKDAVLYPKDNMPTDDDVEGAAYEKYIALIVYMPETVGNEANYKTGEAIPEISLGVNLVATQYTYESDSFDNTYDTDATYLNTDAEGNILISNADELVYFAKTVNVDGNTYSGKIVKLTADIDLAGIDWIPVGKVSSYPSVTFAGTFDGAKGDGGNYTISNMHAVSTETNWAAAGFFGSITGKVQNVNFKNATVESTHYAGVVAGYSSANVGMEISNCHVDGATVTTRVEKLADGSYDNGDKAGGIIGYCVSGDKVTNCSVTNATITGYRDVGGIVGCAAGTISGNSVTNSTILQDVTNGNKPTIPDTFGAIIGRDTGATLEGNTETNVTVNKVTAIVTEAGDLATAIEGAEGNTVVVTTGTYTLPETIPDNVTIVGSGDDTVINANTTYKLTSTGTTISNMKLDGGGTTDTLWITGDNITVSDCTLTNAGGGTWDCNIDVDTDTDITISGCTITNGFRAIMITDANTAYIDNCYLDGVYPINVNASNDPNIKLVVTNTTLNGWTSYGTIGSASFDNCSFGKETYTNAYAHLKPYADTNFTNCSFSSDMTIDTGTTGKTITFTGCTVNGETLTPKLLQGMLSANNNNAGNTWIVDGVTVTLG